MLRHKAMIQCARLAFSYSGIYDQDEAERIVEKDMGTAERVDVPAPQATPATLPDYSSEQFDANYPKWRAAIDDDLRTPDQIISMVESKFRLSGEQKAKIKADPVTGEMPPIDGEYTEEEAA